MSCIYHYNITGKRLTALKIFCGPCTHAFLIPTLGDHDLCMISTVSPFLERLRVGIIQYAALSASLTELHALKVPPCCFVVDSPFLFRAEHTSLHLGWFQVLAISYKAAVISVYMYLCEHKFSTHFNSKIFLEKSHIKFYYTSALFCFPFPEELKNFLFLEVVNKRYLFEMEKKKNLDYSI